MRPVPRPKLGQEKAKQQARRRQVEGRQGGGGNAPVDADALALVELALLVDLADALCVAAPDEPVKDVGDHRELGLGHLDLGRVDRLLLHAGLGAVVEEGLRGGRGKWLQGQSTLLRRWRGREGRTMGGRRESEGGSAASG